MGSRPSCRQRSLFFAVVSRSPEASSHLQAVCVELGRTGAWIVIPQVAPSYAALSDQVTRGHVQIAWAPPLVAIALERAGVARVALCVSRGGGTAYHSALFTSRRSSIRTLADLRGGHVAWVDRASSAGYVLPPLKLISRGLDPTTFFSRESFLHTHVGVARAVLESNADAGATYLSLEPRSARVLAAGWLEAGATGDDVNVLATAGPIPADATVLSEKLPADVGEALTTALVALGRSVTERVRGLFRADGFERVKPAHFEELRRLVDAAGTKR